MNRARAIIWFFLFILAVPGRATNPIDSLKALLENGVTDSLRVEVLNQLAEENRYADHEELLRYAHEALDLAEELEYPKGIAMAYNNIGTYYRLKGIYNQSIDYYFNALEIMESLRDEAGIARCYNLIGILYYSLENYELSLEYYSRALQMNLEQDDKRWVAGNSNNMGMVYEKMGQYDLAKEYYLKSLEMSLELGDKNWIANNYGNLGSLYLKMDNPVSLDYFEKRLKINQEQRDTAGIGYTLQFIGDYYVHEGRPGDALPHFKQALELSRKTRTINLQAEATRRLSRTSAQLGDFRAALEYEKMNKLLEDSLNFSTNTEKITRLEMQYNHKKELRMEELGVRRSRTVQTAISIVLFFLLIFTVLLLNRQRIKARQHRLEQETLSLENKMLEEELKFKERMLEDNIKYLLDINELLASTIEKFNNLKIGTKPENLPIIKEIISILQSGINDDLWKEFEVRFNQIHKDFYDRLNERFPDLTSNEKKLCAFLKLKMTTKEIASITSLSIKSIETARSRLRKKLNIQDNSINLSDFLAEI